MWEIGFQPPLADRTLFVHRATHCPAGGGLLWLGRGRRCGAAASGRGSRFGGGGGGGSRLELELGPNFTDLVRRRHRLIGAGVRAGASSGPAGGPSARLAVRAFADTSQRDVCRRSELPPDRRRRHLRAPAVCSRSHADEHRRARAERVCGLSHVPRLDTLAPDCRRGHAQPPAAGPAWAGAHTAGVERGSVRTDGLDLLVQRPGLRGNPGPVSSPQSFSRGSSRGAPPCDGLRPQDPADPQIAA
jgi:hypothetical protein